MTIQSNSNQLLEGMKCGVRKAICRLKAIFEGVQLAIQYIYMLVNLFNMKPVIKRHRLYRRVAKKQGISEFGILMHVYGI